MEWVTLYQKNGDEVIVPAGKAEMYCDENGWSKKKPSKPSSVKPKTESKVE